MTTRAPAVEPEQGSWFTRLRPTGHLAWWPWFALAFFPLLVLLQGTLLGLRGDHFALAGTFLALSWLGLRGREFVVMGAPMWLSGVGYDFLRLITHVRPAVHVDDLWHAEHALFGFTRADGTRFVLTDFIATHTHPIMDVLTGAVYILYLPFPFLLATVLFFRARAHGRQLALAFGLTSLIGWAIWLAWPAAPPWYVDQVGLGPAQFDTPPSSAGAIRFDQALGVDLFANFYSKSHNVFGAMPSLHAAYGAMPALTAWSLRKRSPALFVGCAVWAGLMAYAAVYLRHHYILDVIAGLAVAGAGHLLARRLLRRVVEKNPSADQPALEGAS